MSLKRLNPDEGAAVKSARDFVLRENLSWEVRTRCYRFFNYG
jgi:hypothetical protein